MKKIKLLLVVLSLVLIPNVLAASGKITVGGPSQAVVGNQIKVTVTLSSSTKIGSWQMVLDYDKSLLSLVGSDAENQNTSMANSSTTGIKSKTYTFTFKALKTGTAKFSVGSYLAYAFDDFSEISLSSSQKNVKIMTQAELEATYSKNNNLSNLSVDGFEITPSFSADVLEYNAVVPEDTTSVNIIASVADKTASVDGAGSHEVTLGVNTFDIVVTAQNGSSKTYKLNVEVVDKNPILVDVDGKEYSIVKIASILTKPNSFTETTVNISDTEIPSFYSEILDYTLVGLKDSEGNVSLYIYKDGNYIKYFELVCGNLTIYPQKINNILKGYSKEELIIQDQNVEVLNKNSKDRYHLIYGVNVESNEEGYFLYDSKDGSLIKFDEQNYKEIQDKILLLTCAVGAFMGTTILSIIITISTKNKRKKQIKKIDVEKVDLDDTKELDVTDKKVKVKNKKNKFNEEPKEIEEKPQFEENNEIKEINEDEEVYDIFEDEHKKKKHKS